MRLSAVPPPPEVPASPQGANSRPRSGCCVRAGDGTAAARSIPTAARARSPAKRPALRLPRRRPPAVFLQPPASRSQNRVDSFRIPQIQENVRAFTLGRQHIGPRIVVHVGHGDLAADTYVVVDDMRHELDLARRLPVGFEPADHRWIVAVVLRIFHTM